MSKNILSDFKSYKDYRNKVILPLNTKESSELEISKNFSKNNDGIKELSNKKIKTSPQDSYESNIQDIRNKILAFANVNESKKENITIEKIIEVKVNNNRLTPEDLFTKLGEPKKSNLKEDYSKRIIVHELVPYKGVVTKKVLQKNNGMAEHQLWQKCTLANTKGAYINYITTYPKGIYLIAAKYRINDLIKA